MSPFVLTLSLALVVAQVPQAPDEVHPSTGRQVLGHSAFVASLVASSALAVGLGLLPAKVNYEATGRPEPLALAGGLMLGAVAEALMAFLVMPEVYRLGGDEVVGPDIGQVRSSAWQYARWPALGAVLSAATVGVGALLERGAYGRGQVVMIVGLGLFAASAALFDVMTILGGVRGYRSGLHPLGATP